MLDELFDLYDAVLTRHRPQLRPSEIGAVRSVGRGIAHVSGLPNVQADEVLRFRNNTLGIAFNLDPDEIGVVLLDSGGSVAAGDEVRRTGRVVDVPVGEELIGRVIDPVGRPLDGRGPVHSSLRQPVEQDAAAIMDRLPVTVPLQTGWKVIDALVPIGRGQRELILGDRQTGKTTIAIDTILNQADKQVHCIYCAIGQGTTAVAKVIAELRSGGGLEYSTVVVAENSAPPGLQFIAPYAATTMGEYLMRQGRDVLVVYDDLTTHARAYRELSLLLRRPPGREAFPGDIFYLHARLLERATHLCDRLGGGSLTALPIAETEAQNVAAYIPTNLISITDGQIYLAPDLLQKGILPAVDVGKSVSRVGGKTQLPAYRAVAGELRLSYAQFEELENFSRFSSRLDEQTQGALRRGQRVREVLKQPQRQPLSVPAQIAVLVAVTAGLLDDVSAAQVREAEAALCTAVLDGLPDLCTRIIRGDKLSAEQRQALLETAGNAIRPFTGAS